MGLQMAVENSKAKPKKRHHEKRKRFEGAPLGNLRVSGRVWVEKDGATYIAWGRVVLLECIEQCGSISAAARSMGISYRHAWLLVESMNSLAPTPLVVAQRGGRKGGGASLTPEGKKAVQGFWLLVQKFETFLGEASKDGLLSDLFCVASS
jgi:molybdate transport system regulatory protein